MLPIGKNTLIKIQLKNLIGKFASKKNENNDLNISNLIKIFIYNIISFICNHLYM